MVLKNLKMGTEVENNVLTQIPKTLIFKVIPALIKPFPSF